jgi:HEAT repeat protein
VRPPGSRVLLPSLAPLLLAGCGSLGGQGAEEAFSDVREFFGASDPVRHARILQGLHDEATWRHQPDVPPTWDACLAEIRTLRESRYADLREAGAAIVFLARCATEDPSALHRAEAVAALLPPARKAREGEDPPAVPGAEDDVGRALKSMVGLHDRELGVHLSPQARADCAAALRTLGDLRIPPPPVASPDEARHAVRILRGTLFAVLAETRSADAHGDGEVRVAADRACANLAVQCVGRSVVAAAQFDADERVRGEAYDALADLLPEGAVETLRSAFGRERSDPARLRLVRALGETAVRGGEGARAAAVPVLIAALDDDASAVRWNARESLRAVAGRDLGDAASSWIAWWASREKPGP